MSAVVESECGFARTQVVSVADLYAGKIVAALDSQHPRDLLDMGDLLATEGQYTKYFVLHAETSLRSMSVDLMA